MPVKEGPDFVAYNNADAPFSNFYVAPFEAPVITEDGQPRRRFQSVEQYFSYCKAMMFGDRRTAQQILQHTSGRDLRRDGRSVTPFNAVRWGQISEQVLTTGMQAKFSQNPELRQMLLDTGDKTLIEGNGADRRYGAGIWTNRINSKNVPGENRQGQMLMAIRQDLVKQQQNQQTDQASQPSTYDSTDLQTVPGDLSLVDHGIVFQQVNAAGLMGAGLARSLREVHPEVYRAYRRAYDQAPEQAGDTFNSRYRRRVKQSLGGQYQDVSLNNGDLHVINSFSQLDLGRGSHYTNEDWLIDNLQRAAQQAADSHLPLYVPEDVGAGLAGGDRQKIQQALQSLVHRYGNNVVIPVSYQEGVVPRVAEYQGQNYQQLSVDSRKPYYIALTGHRPKDVQQYMNGENPYDYDNQFWTQSRNSLMNLIERRLQEHPEGLELHSGMALGADTVWAQAIVAERQKHPDQIKFVADVPLPTQASRWPEPSQKLWRSLVDQADEVKITSQGPYRPQVMELRNQQMINPSDETVAFWNGRQQGGTANGVRDAQKAQVRITQISPQSIQRAISQSTPVQGPKTLSPSTEESNQKKEGNSVAQEDQNKKQERHETLFYPTEDHQLYVEIDPDSMDNGNMPTVQDRYPWRSRLVTESSPVTVDELMRALNPAITRKGNRSQLRDLLRGGLSARVQSTADKNRDLVSTTDEHGRQFDLSPSHVQTILTVLRVAHDANLDYDIVAGPDNTIALKLKDNSRAMITLVDPQEPQRVGDVSLPNRTHWGVELGRLTYLDADGNHMAIMNGIEQRQQNGQTVVQNQSPLVDVQQKSGDSYQNYRYSARRIQHWNLKAGNYANVTDRDTQQARIRAMARYVGLDQTTRNRLAVVSMVNALGIQPNTLSPDLRPLTAAGKIETAFHMGRSGYQSQVNLGGNVDADIAPVDVYVGADPQSNDQPRVRHYRAQDLNGGPIKLNLGSASVVDNNIDGRNRNESIDPEQMDSREANNLIIGAYWRARFNYLTLLTGEDQSNVNEQLAGDQKALRRALSNQHKVEGLFGEDKTDLSQHSVELEPLDANSQKLVLDQFRQGLMNSEIEMDQVVTPQTKNYEDDAKKKYFDVYKSINDSSLHQARENIRKSTNNPVLRSRRLQAFDDVCGIFNRRFGTAPISNPVQKNDVLSLSLQEYRDNMMRTMDRSLSRSGHQVSDEVKQERLTALESDFDQFKDQLDGIAKNAFGDSFDQSIWEALPMSQQRDVLDSLDDGHQSVVAFDQAVKQFQHDHQLDKRLNLTQVIEASKANDGRGVDYEFKIAQALGKSKFKDQVAGNNDSDMATLMERSVEFDPDSAMTADQLRQADKTGHEAELQQYVADVKAGRKQFSFDPNENPEPGAFKFDGSGLINPVSKNEFKARALELVQQRLAARGADPKHTTVQIDKHGVIHFKTQIPYYRMVDHTTVNSGQDWQRDENGNIKHSDEGIAYSRPSKSTETRYQPIEGSIGQVFAPDHDGLIRTTYNRFSGFDESKLGQQTFLPRMRASYQLLPTDDNGKFRMDVLQEEKKNGLGPNNRLRIATYSNLFDRMLAQSVDSLISTRNIGDVTHYNSTTIMSKLMHGGVLGNQAPEALLNETPSPERQAKLETQERAVRFDDNAAAATKTTEVVSFAVNYQKAVMAMRREANDELSQLRSTAPDSLTDEMKQRQSVLETQLKSPYWPSREEVQDRLQSPLSMYGGHSLGELAHSEDMYYFSDSLTGQGGTLGPVRYLNNGVKVNSDMTVEPNVFRDSDGKPLTDENGKYVGYMSYTPEELMDFYNLANKNAFDRESVGKEQGLKGHETIDHAKVANMSLSGLTTEDAMVVSKEFAEKHAFVDSQGNKRPIKIGDKISDQGGNKATVAMVIDPDMSLEEAEKKNVLDVVRLFHDNPDLEAVMNGMSQLSRNNGATTYTMLHDESSEPMKFTSYRRNANGEFESQGEVQTNATINTGKLIITDQSVDHKVTLYDKAGDKGRKGGGLNLFSDVAKKAPHVANYYRNYENGLLSWRRHLLGMGLDMTEDGRPKVADYGQLMNEGQVSQVEYKISPDNWRKLSYPINDANHPLLAKSRDGLMHFRGDNKQPGFDGLGDDGKLTQDSLNVLDNLQSYLASDFRANMTKSDDAMSDSYNASRDFLSQLPDGGLLKLPEGLHLTSSYDMSGKQLDSIYVLPLSMRRDTRQLNDMTIQSNFNRYYSELGEKLARYQQLRAATLGADLAGGDPKVQEQIDQRLADDLGIQRTYDRLTTESKNMAFGSGDPKFSEFNTKVLAGRINDSVTTQVSSNPNLPMNVIEVSPAIAKKLGFVQDGNGRFDYAHMKDHPNWDRLHVHRDPIWREQGSLAFKVKINPELSNVRISPIIASLMDGDFDGDNLGLIAMKGDQVQEELRDKCSVEQWMLDNNTTNDFAHAENLMNINAELVDMAVQTNQEYRIPNRDHSEMLTVKPFEHKKDANGVPVKFADDTDLQRNWATIMSQLRPDVLPSSVLNKDGQFDFNAAQSAVAAGKVTDGDMLNMMVNHTIKTSYESGRDVDGFVDHAHASQAMMDVEDIVQTARGMEKQIDPKTQQAYYTEGVTSTLVNDGVNYTDEHTLKDSLNRYVNEGAKGHPGSVEGLFEYMDKPTTKELVELGKKQQNPDGTLNAEAIKKYQEEMSKLHDQMLAVQKATKEKSDITGVPGNIQKMVTNVLANDRYKEAGLHAANAIGQAGTQKVLSIKRDPIGAGVVAETLQGPITGLLSGQRPNDYPTFSLMGAERDGLLGDTITDVSARIAALHQLSVPGKWVTRQNSRGETYQAPATIFTAPQPLKLTDKQVWHMSQQLGLNADLHSKEEQDAYLSNFRETLQKAATPLIPDKYVDENKQEHKLLEPGYQVNDGTNRAEFVKSMDYLYNQKMGCGVNPANFAVLADALVGAQGGLSVIDGTEKSNQEIIDKCVKAVNDPEHAYDQVHSCKGATSVNLDELSVAKVPADPLFRVKQQGLSAFQVEASQGSASAQLFGQEGSWERQAYMGGASDDDLKKMMDLNARENGYDKTDEHVATSVTAQDEILAGCHKDIEDAVHNMKTLDESQDEDVDDLGELDYDDDGSQDLDDLEKLTEDSVAQAQADSHVSTGENTASQATSTTGSSAETPDSSVSSTVSHQDPVANSAAPSQADDQVDPDQKTDQSTASQPASQNAPQGQAGSKVVHPASSETTGQTAQSQRQRQRRQMREAAEAGTFVTAFTAEVGGNKANLTTANQYVAYKYYEKAWKAGVRLNPADKVPEKLRDGSNVEAMHDAMLALYKSTKEQLGTDLFSIEENKQFKSEALHMQADNNPTLKMALGWAKPEVNVPNMPFGNTTETTNATVGTTNKKPKSGGEDNNNSSNHSNDDGLSF